MSIMTTEWTRRAHWHQLPAHVRTGIENLLGPPVSETANQVDGMSPGYAARVRGNVVTWAHWQS